MNKTLILLSLLFTAGIFAFPSYASAQDATEIVRKAEEKVRGTKTSRGDFTMTIVRPDWTREMSMRSWSKGTDYALILVLSPARDKGVTNLKRKKEVWNWMPRIERTVKLPPSMMSQSWMGSDFTNDDLVREFSLTNDYAHRILGDTTIEDLACHKVELIPNEEAAVIWGKVHLFISKEEYLQLRAEYYDEDGYLINVMQGTEIKELGGRLLATRVEIKPVEKEGHSTILHYDDIEFDKPIPESFFTIQNMKRVR